MGIKVIDLEMLLREEIFKFIDLVETRKKLCDNILSKKYYNMVQDINNNYFSHNEKLWICISNDMRLFELIALWMRRNLKLDKGNNQMIKSTRNRILNPHTKEIYGEEFVNKLIARLS